MTEKTENPTGGRAMNIEPALVGKVAAVVRSERLKHTDPSDAVLALAAIRAIFDWQPIETAPKVKNQPVLICWRERVKRSGPKQYRFFVSEGMWDDGTADNEPQDFNSDDASWVLPSSDGFEEPTHWLPMIPLPEVV